MAVRREGEGAIADDARLVAGGVAGIAQIQQLRHQAPVARCGDQAVDGRAPQTARGRERPQLQDIVGGLPVELLGGGVGVVVGQVRN
jgi:hypothetical protein